MCCLSFLGLSFLLGEWGAWVSTYHIKLFLEFGEETWQNPWSRRGQWAALTAGAGVTQEERRATGRKQKWNQVLH